MLFPDAGRPGEADDPRLAGVRIDLAHQLPAGGVVVLDERDAARQRALVAAQQPLGERRLLRTVPAVIGAGIYGRRRAQADFGRGAAVAAVHLPHPLPAGAPGDLPARSCSERLGQLPGTRFSDSGGPHEREEQRRGGQVRDA